MCKLGAMSAWIATPLARDFTKIILFSAYFLRAKIGWVFACKGLHSSSRTCNDAHFHRVGHCSIWARCRFVEFDCISVVDTGF